MGKFWNYDKKEAMKVVNTAKEGSFILAVMIFFMALILIGSLERDSIIAFGIGAFAFVYFFIFFLIVGFVVNRKIIKGCCK